MSLIWSGGVKIAEGWAEAGGFRGVGAEEAGTEGVKGGDGDAALAEGAG